MHHFHVVFTLPAELRSLVMANRRLLHVLPKGFVRIRHFGVLAASNVTTKLEVARQLLEARAESVPTTVVARDTAGFENSSDYVGVYLELTGVNLRCCPICGADGLTLCPLPALARAPPLRLSAE